MMRRLPQLLLICLLASGCSGMRLAYGYGDWFLTREADKYLCLSKDQKATVRKDAARLMRWHKKHELPRYARALQRFADSLDHGMKRPALEAFSTALDEAWRRAVTRAAPRAAVHLRKPGAMHLKCLSDRLGERHKTSMKRFEKTGEEYARARLDKRLERLEPWLGTFTAVQREHLAKLLPVDPALDRFNADARGRANQRFYQSLVAGKPMGPELLAFAKNPFYFYAPADRAKAERFRNGWVDRVMAIGSVITPAQRAHLQKTLRGYADDIRSLSAR